MNYLDILQVQFGIPLWLIITIFIWSLVWKLVALWKSARKTHIAWFIVMGLVNTVGILEILYVYLFSEMTPQKKPMPKTVKKKSPKRKVKKKSKK